MSRISQGMSPVALAISILSLVVATSSAAYAIVVGTNQIADGAVTTAKLHGNAVVSSKVKDGGLSAADLSNAAKNALRVRAFAAVDVTTAADPILMPGRTRGFSAVTRTGTGQYCLTLAASAGVDPDNVVAAVTPEWGFSGGDHLQAYWDTGLCGDNQIGVLTDQDDVDSNSVSFSVIVP